MARPTKYKPSYGKVALELIGEQGKSIVQLARELRVSRSTIYLWAEENPEFSDILACARDWSEAYWEDKFLKYMEDRNVNAPLVKLYFATRFKWREAAVETEEVETPAPVSVTVERRDARITEQPSG
jgi:hypothetical protein